MWGQQGQCSKSVLSLSHLVVDVSRALRRHLLHDVDGVAVITAHFLVVRAEDAVGRPQRDDDVAGLGAVVVAAASFGCGERAERQRGGVRGRVLAVAPPVFEQQHYQHGHYGHGDHAG